MTATPTPYQSNFSTADITALADAWSAMAGTFAAETSTMNTAVLSMAWMGDGYTAAINAWENGISAGQLQAIPQACQQIADALTAYAQAIQQYQQQVAANLTAQQNASDIAALVSGILMLAGLAAAPFLGPVLGALGELIDAFIPALSDVIVAVGGFLTPLADITPLAFTAGAIGGAAVALGGDALATWIGDAATGLPFSMSEPQIISDIVTGGVLGGVGGLHSSEDPIPDPATVVTDHLPAGDSVVTGPVPSPDVKAAPAPLPGEPPAPPLPVDATPVGAPTTLIPEGVSPSPAGLPVDVTANPAGTGPDALPPDLPARPATTVPQDLVTAVSNGAPAPLSEPAIRPSAATADAPAPEATAQTAIIAQDQLSPVTAVSRAAFGEAGPGAAAAPAADFGARPAEAVTAAPAGSEAVRVPVADGSEKAGGTGGGAAEVDVQSLGAAEKLTVGSLPEGSFVTRIANVELPSFDHIYRDRLLDSGPPAGVPKDSLAADGKPSLTATEPNGLTAEADGLPGATPGFIDMLREKVVLPPSYPEKLPPAYAEKLPAGHGPGDEAPLSASARDQAAGPESLGALPEGSDRLGVSARADPYSPATDEALVQALRRPAPGPAELKRPESKLGGPGFDPGKVRDVITERRQWVEAQLDERPSANADALTGTTTHTAGSASPAERLAAPLDQPTADALARSGHEQALDALAHAVGVKEELADGGRPGGTVYRPGKQTGTSEPPGRWTQISRDLEQITGQRRQLLDEQARLHDQPAIGPKTQAASERLTEIGAGLKKLDDHEAELFAEQIRRWGQPRTGNLEPAPAVNKDQLAGELKKVTAARREVLTVRTALRDSAGPRSPDPEETSITTRLENLNARESALLNDARSLEAAHNAAELDATARHLTEISARIGPVRQKVEGRLAASPGVVRRIQARLDDRLSQLDGERSRLLGESGGAPPAGPRPEERLGEIAAEHAQVTAQKQWLEYVGQRAKDDVSAAQAKVDAAQHRLDAARQQLAEADLRVSQIRDRWLGRTRGAGLVRYRAPGWLDNPVGRPLYRKVHVTALRARMRALSNPVAGRVRAATAVESAGKHLARAQQHLASLPQPAGGPSAQASRAFQANAAELRQLTTAQQNLSDTWIRRYASALTSDRRALPGWVLPRPAAGAGPGRIGPAGAGPAPAGPTGFELTHVRSGMFAHPLGTAVPGEVLAEAGAVVPDAGVFRVFLDPRQAGTGLADQIRGYLAGLPPAARAITGIYVAPGTGPYDPAALSDLAGQLAAPVTALAAGLSGVPPASPQVVPLRASGRVTEPGHAAAFEFAPPGTAPPGLAARPAPPLRSALKHPGARKGSRPGGPDVKRVQFAPEQITGGWFFPLDHDDPAVRRAADNLPGFEGHQIVAVHFDQQAGRFEADGRQYGFSEFAARLTSLPGWVPGRAVVLVSCVLASTSVLEAFAASLGSDVVAGLDDVWRTAAGDVISAPAAGGEKTRPDLAHQAEWLRVTRDGTPPVRYHGTLADVMSQLGATALDPAEGVAGRWTAPPQDVRFSSVSTGFGGFGGFGGGLSPPTHASGAAGTGTRSTRAGGGSDSGSTRTRAPSVRSGIPATVAEEPEGMPDRELPPGFGVEVDGVRQFPMGHRGRFVRLGGVRLGDDAGIAGLAAAALPPGGGLDGAVTGLAGKVTGRVLRFLGEHGNHAFIQRLLDGGLTFEVVTGALRQEVTVGLDLGDPAQWAHLREVNPENRPVGEIEHGAVEADHEIIAGSRRTVGSGRDLSVTADVKTPTGALPSKVFPVVAGATLAGGSSSEFTSGSDTVSAAKRYPVSHGGTTYFDFPGASLTTRVRPAGHPGPGETGRLSLNGGARAGFPEEFSPAKEPGDPPGAFRAVARTLPGARRLGVTQEQVAANALIDPDPGPDALGGAGITVHIRQATADSGGSAGASASAAAVPAREAAEALQTVLSQFLVTPESAGGLPQIRAQVYAALAEGLDEPDPDLAEGVEFFLSEPSFLRMWGDITGPGAVSQLITGSGGRRAYLIVRAELRTVQASTIDPVPVKEELQRFTNVVDEAVQSGQVSLTVPQVEADYTIGDPTAPDGGNSGAYVKAGITGTLSADRSQLANTGSGDIRGVVFHGESVRYTTRMHLIVQIARESEAPAAMPTVQGGIVVGLRVPGIQRARFEALINEAVHQAGADIPVDDEPDEGRTSRYPPESMAAGQGMGFSAVSHLHGAQDVLPAILNLIQGGDAPLAWARPWNALEFAYLASQLNAKFTREALSSGAAGLFQPGGETMELFRPARDGSEIISVTVRAVRGADYTARGRIEEATLEVMPSAFAGNSAADTVGTSIAGSVTAGGGIGLDTNVPPRSLGASLAVSGSRTHSATTRAQASGFGLEAMLYEGPARYFDYDVDFRIEVRIRNEPSIVVTGWMQLFAALAKTAFTPADAEAAKRQGVTVRDRVGGGSVRFIMPEMLTREGAPDPAVVAATGQTRVLRFRPLRRRPHPRRRPDRTVTLPDVRPFLGSDGHVPLNPDDQVMEVLGSHQIGSTLKSLLLDAGMNLASIGDLHWTTTSPVHLSSSMVRGPSVLMNTVVRDGIVTDRHAVIRIEGYPTNARPADTAPIEMFQMHVAEGDGTVSSSQAKAKSFSYSFTVLYGLLAGVLGGGEQQVNPSAGYTRTRGSTRAKTRTITPTSGRLTQALRNYRENAADMVWRISVTAHDQNMVYRGLPRHAAAIVIVQRGLSFLRLADPVPDPRFASGRPAKSGTVPEIRRAPAPATARDGARQVPVLPSTPGSARTVPIVPLFPPSAASERLFPTPPAAGADPGPAGVTGEGNPVLKAVRELLEAQAPELLEAHWTIENGNPPERQVPASLQNVLNLGSLTMLMDLMLGPGLVLTAPARAVPLAHERVQILLRARRDPDNQGYAFLEHVEKANVSRYAFRLDIDNAAQAKATGNGWQVQVPQENAEPDGGPLHSGEAELGGSGTETITIDGYQQSVEATRDTLFIDGPADRYGGEVEIQVSLSATYLPSRLANAAGMTLPQKLASQVQRSGDQRRTLPARDVRVKERVLVPLDLIRKDTLPEIPATATAAVEEVRPGAALTGAGLDITRDDILSRQVFNLGFDHEKLQVLFDEVTARLAGNETPASGQRSAAVSRLIEHGTISRHALHYMLSYPMLTRQLEFMLDQHGFAMPGLAREGGPLTDTHGKLNVSVRLVSPQVRGYFNGWLESVGYHFAEFNASKSQGFEWSTSGSGGPTLNTGDRSQTSPVSPQKQNLATSAEVKFSGWAARTGYGVLQVMTRAVARNRRIPWLRVGADAVITVTLAARNQRDKIDLPGGTVTVSFLVRNALELGVSPEASIRLGLPHRSGIPVPGGRYFPRPGDDANVLAAAFNMPLYTRDGPASELPPAGRLDPALRDWFTVTGHYDYQQDTFHVGYAYPPDTPFPELFQVLNGLSPAEARFRGGPDLTDVEFAAHLWHLFEDEHRQFHGEDLPTLPDLVIAAGHAGAPGPAGRLPFAQRVAGYLYNRVLASRAHVYHTPEGQTWSVNYWFDTAGRPLTAGARPDTGEGPASSRHPWIVFNRGRPHAIQPTSHDLRTVITAQVSDDAPIPMPAAAPRISPPPSGFTLLGQLRPSPGSPLDGEIAVTGGLVAGPLAGHPNMVVIRPAGPFDPADDLTDAEQALIDAMPTEAPVVSLLITADVSAANLPPDDLAAAVEEAARALTRRFEVITVHYDADGADHRNDAVTLAERLSDRTRITTAAANGTVLTTPAGLFTYARDNLAASWWHFDPAQPAPVRLGALADPELTWQVRLEEELEDLGVPDDVAVHRIPAGLVMLPSADTIPADEYARLLEVAREVQPDPERVTLAVDLRAAHQVPGMLNYLISNPLLHHLTPPALDGRPQSIEHPGAWAYRPWLVEQIPAGLWLHSDQSPAARRAEVASIPPGPRYQIIIDSPVVPDDWETAGRLVLDLLRGTQPNLTLSFPQQVRGHILDVASEIVAGPARETIEFLPRLDPALRTAQRSVTLDDDALAALQPGRLHVNPHPVLARAHPAGGTFPVPAASNARMIYEFLPARTDARDASPMLPQLALGAVIPEGTSFQVGRRDFVHTGDGRLIREIHLMEYRPARVLPPPRPQPPPAQPPEPQPPVQPPPPAQPPPVVQPPPPVVQPPVQPLPPGWQWLDAGRGLAVPVDPALTGGIRTPLQDWRAAEPGPSRGYAVHLSTGIMVLDDRTVVPLSYGWVQYGTGLVHYGTGVILDRDASVAHTPADLTGLRGADQLSREDLLGWLAARGALADEIPGLPSGPGWQQVTDVHGGQQWMWGGPGPTPTLPPGLTRGTATATGLQCLTDSLRKLLGRLLPDQQRDQMTLDFLARWFRDHLPVNNEAYEQMLAGQMVDVWSVLPTFTSIFQVRVQVFQHVLADPAGPATILPSRLVGPPRDQEGNPTPVLHLYWRGEHFEPLFAPVTARLPQREPLGAGPPAAPTADMTRPLAAPVPPVAAPVPPQAPQGPPQPGGAFIQPAFQVVSGDMLRMPRPPGAIVNPTNPTMLGGGGVAGAISLAGGRVLSDEITARYPVLPGTAGTRITLGQAHQTSAPGMNAQFVIHVLPPNLSIPAQNDLLLLRAAYRNAVNAADQALRRHYDDLLAAARDQMTARQLADMATIAFPVLSGDLYRGTRPRQEILRAAIDELSNARTTFIRTIHLVIYAGDHDMATAYLTLPGGPGNLPPAGPSGPDSETAASPAPQAQPPQPQPPQPQPPPGTPAAGEAATQFPYANFGPSVRRPRRGPADPPPGEFTLRLGGDALDGLLRRVLDYLSGPGLPSPGEDTINALVAVLAEAEHLAGATPREPQWNDRVAYGLTTLPPALRQASFYAGSLPGIDAGQLAVRGEFTVNGLIHAHTRLDGLDGDTLFIISSTAGRDVSRLAGGGSDLVMFDRGHRFRVSGITRQPGGHQVIEVQDLALLPAIADSGGDRTGRPSRDDSQPPGAGGTAEPGSRPMPFLPGRFGAGPATSTENLPAGGLSAGGWRPSATLPAADFEASPPPSPQPLPNQPAHASVDPFAGLPAEAVAIRASDGAYMTVPSGVGTITGMDDPLFFTAAAEPLGGVWLADTSDDGHEVFFSTIQNNTQGVKKVTYLVMWYLAKHATGQRVRVGKVANQGLAAMLTGLGMVEVPGRLLAGLTDMAGDRQAVYRAARQAAIAQGWTLRDADIQGEAAEPPREPERVIAASREPEEPAGLETDWQLSPAPRPPRHQAPAPVEADPAAHRELVMRYRSGDPNYDLDAAQKSQLIGDLLAGQHTVDDQLAAFILLRMSDDDDLAALFGDDRMLPLLEAAFPADGRTGAALLEFLSERFEGGRDAVAEGLVDPHGHYAERFDPALVSQVLADAIDLTGELTASQAADLARPSARPTADRILEAIQDLPPVELARAMWWLTRARVVVHDQLDTQAGETRQGLQLTVNELDAVLTWLYRRLTHQTDAATLQSLTVTPRPDLVPRLRSALDPRPGPAFTRQLPGEPGEFRVTLRAAMLSDIGLLEQRYLPGRGEAEHANQANLFPMDHIERLARQAKEWTDEVFGEFASSRALVPDRPGQRGNIHDAFADADREIQQMDEEGRVELAQSFLRRFLTWRTESAGILSAHHADPVFGPAGEPLNDEAQVVHDVISGLAGDPDTRSRALNLYRASPGRAQPETSEIWIDAFRRPELEENQRFLWDTSQTLIHEYLHLLEHPRYARYANSLGAGTHAHNALVEGVVSLLTEIVWSEVEAGIGSQRLRDLIEGEYAGEAPLSPDRMPHPSQQRYASHAEVMRLVQIVGVENLYAAFFLGEVERITGPIAGG